MRAAWTLLALSALLAGCEGYAETVGCGMGLVLDENDECVPPQLPDGGSAITTCAELCDVYEAFTGEQRACLEARFAALGTPPASCMAIATSEECVLCIMESAAPDDACAGAAALCP